MGLCAFPPWWSVLAAQQPKSSKTDLASLVSLAVLLALSLWWSVLAAQQPNPSKRTLPALHWVGVGWGGMITSMFLCAHRHGNLITRELRWVSVPFLPGGPFWPLSSPNPPKRTSPAWSAWLCSLPFLCGGPFWPLSSPNPSKRPPQLFHWVGVGWGGMITSMFLCAHRHGNLIKRELAVSLCPFLSLVVRFGRSAAQILQNGPRQLGQLGCALCSPSGGPFRPLSSPNPSKRTSPALPMGGGGGGVGLGGMITSMFLCAHRHGNLITRELAVGSLSLSLPGGPFWPLSSPNPPKRTSPAWVSLAVLLAAQILQNGPRQLGLLGCAPCSPSGVPFWPLSGPNPPKRTSPAWSAWVCSLLSPWWSVLGRSAAQILQNGPRQLGQLG